MSIIPPASGEPAQARLRAGEQDLAAFLADVGCATPLAAKEAAQAHRDATQAVALLAAQLEAACPEDAALDIGAGLESLRGALALETRPGASASPDIGAAGAEDVDAAWQTARTAEREAEGRRQAALDTLQEAQIASVKLTGQVERTAGDVSRLGEQLTAPLDAMDAAALPATNGRASCRESGVSVRVEPRGR